MLVALFFKSAENYPLNLSLVVGILEARTHTSFERITREKIQFLLKITEFLKKCSQKSRVSRLAYVRSA